MLIGSLCGDELGHKTAFTVNISPYPCIDGGLDGGLDGCGVIIELVICSEAVYEQCISCRLHRTRWHLR